MSLPQEGVIVLPQRAVYCLNEILLREQPVQGVGGVSVVCREEPTEAFLQAGCSQTLTGGRANQKLSSQTQEPALWV